MQNLCQTELLHVAASCATQEGFSQHLSSDNKDLPRLKVTVQEAPGSLTKALWKLLQDSRGSSDRTLNPRQLFGEICKTATRFKGFRQQDSQELLRYLFDSIRTEELKRVKLAVLKSFGVTGGADAKTLDDNKRTQIKEYGASAEAPLIDSVFAGRLVSIVTCHQCHQEFKVEETFLDLSLPLMSPPQESYSDKFHAKGGKQSSKSPKTPNSESTNVEVSSKETEKDSKAKTPSKHQQKSARKAERKKGKKGKGHGKKGKAFQDANDNKEDDEEEKGDSGEEGDELDQMNVSDLDEQEHKLNGSVGPVGNDNATEESVNSSGGPEAIPNYDVQLEGVGSNLQHSAQSSEKDCDTSALDSNRAGYEEDKTVKRDCTERTEVVEDSLKSLGENQVILNEDAAKNLQTERNDSQQKVTNEGDCVTCEGDDKHHQSKLLSDDKMSSMDFSNCNKTIHADEMAELNSRNMQCVDGGNTSLPTEPSDCKLENELQVCQNEPEVKLANDGTRSVWSSINAIVEEIVNSALKTSLDKAFTSTCVENPLEDHAVQEEGKCTLKNCSETFTATEGLPQLDEHLVTGIETFAETEGLPPGEFKTISVDNGEQHCFDNSIGARREENDREYEGRCSDSNKENGTEEAIELAVTNGENFDECEVDSEEENEPGCISRKPLTLQPTYDPSPGECSVMSCLSQFCVSEMLDGNNKFACEECSKRAQRVNEGKGASAAKHDNKDDDDTGDSSLEDEPKGATASKPSTSKKKDSKHRTVYTVASKQMLISLAPPVLTLHLKRFQQARFTLRKLTKHVDFPVELNLGPFCSRSGKTRPDSEGQVLYSLYGVIQHSGNMNSGHYTACVKVREPPVKGLYDKITSMSELTEFIKNMWTAGKTGVKHGNSRCRHEPAPDGQWFHVSDASVVAIAETKVLKSQAYMLFYGRLPLGSR
ncbi:ubiquitin carboxyl-terminal hydrolase 16-like [Orbicella faveolata]|uniref:ubiquitin carboxyl-terminal hydrolase 16-like n=1 Tax=Orbicella faveolata TaxID=48498 RepID=UPI0009E4F688|nr:ubiquitin carboxyl-terminal hydrolase 16-like [Orbicella faveolata]